MGSTIGGYAYAQGVRHFPFSHWKNLPPEVGSRTACTGQESLEHTKECMRTKTDSSKHSSKQQPSKEVPQLCDFYALCT